MSDLIAALSEPAAYPHAVREVRVVQTHASCVFLTGEYAYKIKKPVNFGFLDYSTLERRRHFCERELELNRRLCPGVYLDVVPVVQHGGRLQVQASGEPVEWAVRMRQLPEEDMLPVRLARGAVSAADMIRIAATLADFHARAATNPHVRSFATPAAIARNADENFSQTERFVGRAPWAPLSAEHVRAIRRYTHEFLRTHEPELHRRMEEGRIRDGHGDLRAQNLCLCEGLQEGVQVFDCIEFNERFRYQDVAADLAYLAMDLDLAGRADLRDALVWEYMIRSGDSGFLKVLPFYLCYRACVRGKIALFSAEEPEIPSAQREAETELAACAFDLARSYAELRSHSLLLITVGLSGSGKSRLARELARRLPAVVHSSDEVRKELAGRALSERLEPEWYRPERVAQVYRELRRRARASLARGLNVILDATFLSATERRATAALARERGVRFRILECRCSPAVARQRIRDRRQGRATASDADLAVYEAQRQRYETPREAFSPEWMMLETDRPVAELARMALRPLWAAAG